MLYTPTAYKLVNNGGPPEYYPLLIIAAVFFLINSLVLLWQIRRHSPYFRNEYFKLSSRVFMIMSSFWVYGICSFLGMMFIRGNIFLQFLSHTFESACMLTFFDIIRVYMRASGYTLDGTRTVNLRGLPCCYCIVCCPTPKNTKQTVRALRRCIYPLIFFQTLVEIIRVLAVSDCEFSPTNTHTIVWDVIVIVCFILAFWSVHVAAKNCQDKLTHYRLAPKFIVYKLMIFTSKALSKILNLVATQKKIPAYEDWLDSVSRAVIWGNFITVVVSTILISINSRLYLIEDYETISGTPQVRFSRGDEDVIVNTNAEGGLELDEDKNHNKSYDNDGLQKEIGNEDVNVVVEG